MQVCKCNFLLLECAKWDFAHPKSSFILFVAKNIVHDSMKNIISTRAITDKLGSSLRYLNITLANLMEWNRKNIPLGNSIILQNCSTASKQHISRSSLFSMYNLNNFWNFSWKDLVTEGLDFFSADTEIESNLK